MAPFADCLNHHHGVDCTFYMVNKELHVNPLKHKSYFKSEKYLNNMSLIYKTGSEADQAALNNDLINGY